MKRAVNGYVAWLIAEITSGVLQYGGIAVADSG